MFLHCYHDFRLGGLRKFMKINYKMETIKIRGIHFGTAEKFLQNLPCCGVTYQYWHMSELIKRRRFLNHADCLLKVTPSQCGDSELPTFICIVVYRSTLTVWHSLHTALYVALYTRTHAHTQKITYENEKASTWSVVKNIQYIVKPAVSLPLSLQHANCPYPEPHYFTPSSPIIFI